MLELLPHLSYTADAVTRGDLSHGMLVDERAYVASWLARTRDLWRLAGFSSEVVVRQPPQRVEVTYGVDAIFAINLGGLWKFMAVEAKRPGFAKHIPWWDQVKKNSKGIAPPWSRFSRQIMRQDQLRKSGWVTGGLFIDERSRHSFGFDPLGCSFLPHSVLTAELPGKAVPTGMSGIGWTTAEVLALLVANAGSQLTNIRQVLERLVDCEDGDPLRLEQVETMTMSLRDLKGERTELEEQLLIHGVDDDSEFPELIGRSDSSAFRGISGDMDQIAVLGVVEEPRDVPVETRIIQDLVEVTGAGQGIVFSLPESREASERTERWHARNKSIRPAWEG